MTSDFPAIPGTSRSGISLRVDFRVDFRVDARLRGAAGAAVAAAAGDFTRARFVATATGASIVSVAFVFELRDFADVVFPFFRVAILSAPSHCRR
jgi:hypothetical protein